jgi:hypothetical protein
MYICSRKVRRAFASNQNTIGKIMGRHLKYPELLELKVGESLFIPRDEIGSIQTLRNIVHRLAKANNLRLAVRDDYSSADVEVARLVGKTESGARVGSSTFTTMTREQLSAAIGERLAQINAQD